MSDTSKTEPEPLQEQPSPPHGDDNNVEEQPLQSDDPIFTDGDDEGGTSWSVAQEQPDEAEMEAIRKGLSSIS